MRSAMILPATVATPGSYTVTYYNPGVTLSCPAGGAVQAVNTTSCVNTGVNFRADGISGSTYSYRAVQSLSTTLPIFTRVELFGLNAANEWVFIQRCAVPGSIPTNTTVSCTNGAGTVTGSDNGLERYWVYAFTNVPATGFTEFRAVGVNSGGVGLFSTVQP